MRNIKHLSALVIIFVGICLFQTTSFGWGGFSIPRPSIPNPIDVVTDAGKGLIDIITGNGSDGDDEPEVTVVQSPAEHEGKWVNWDVTVSFIYDGTTESMTISEEGSTTKVRYNATATVKIDKTSPKMSEILVNSIDSTGLVKNYTDSVTLRSNGEDVYPEGVTEISGEKGFQYSINSGTWTNGQEFKLSTDGVHEVAFRVYDDAGNYSEPIKTTVIIDRTLQDVNQIADDKGTSFNPQNNSDTVWKYTEPVEITASGNNAEGSKGFEYKINDGAWISGSQLSIEEDGFYDILFRGVGKYNNYSDEKGLAVIIDREGPYIEEEMDESWHSVETFEVNLSAVDELTTVKRVQYSINGSDLVEVPDGNIIFSISEEGETPFVIKATDELGNESEIDYKVRIDRTKPFISLRDIDGKTLETNNILPIKTNKSFTVKASAFDELSGIKNIKYRLNVGEWILGDKVEINESGKWNLEFEAFDMADNCINSGVLSVVVDVEPPEVTFIGTDGNWTNEETVTVSVNAVDKLSEIGKIEISSDGKVWQEIDEITVSKEGESTFYVRVSDIWGNVVVKIITIKIDKSYPQITIKDHNDLDIKSTVNPYKYNKNPTTFTLTSDDSISGIEILRYRVNNGEWINKDTVELNSSGSWMLEVEAVDRASNKTTSGIISVLLDVDAPELFIKGTDEVWKNTESISVCADVYDSFSEIESIEYSIDGINWNLGNKLVISDEKETLVQFKATDSFGNITIKEGPVRIDRSIPSIELSNVGTTPVPYEKVEVLCKAEDRLSGINESSFRYSIDGGEWLAAKTALVTKEGITNVRFEVGDNTGNIATVSGMVYMDRKAPVITDLYLKEASDIAAPRLEDGCYTDLDKLFLFVSSEDYFVDSRADVSHYLYSISFSPTREGTSETKVEANGGSLKTILLESLKKGTNYIYIYAVDRAGNRSPVKTLCIKVDGEYPNKPDIRSSTHPFANTPYDAVSNRNAVFHLGVGTSGVLEVKEYRYSLLKGDKVIAKDVAVTGSSIEFKELEDNAEQEYYKLYVDLVSGNGRKTREPAEYSFRIDSKPPEFFKITSCSHPVENQWYNKAQVSFEWNMPADFTGVKSFYYQLSEIDEEKPFTVTEEVYSYGKTFLTTENLKVDFDLSENNIAKNGKVRLIVFAEDFSGNVQWDDMTAAYDIEKPLLDNVSNTEEKLKVFASGSKDITMEWGEAKDNTGVFEISAGIMECGVDENWSFFIKGQAKSHTFKDLKSDSTYLLAVRLTDMAGNIRLYQKAFRIDGGEIAGIDTVNEEIVCGYTVEIICRPEEDVSAWLVLPESMNFEGDSDKAGKIKLDKELKIEEGQFVAGGSDKLFSVNLDGMKLRCEGLYISNNGLVIKKAYYKPFGCNKEIVYNDVKLSSPLNVGVIKSSISEDKIENINLGGFLIKDITRTFLQSGSFVINSGKLDAINMNCYTDEGETSNLLPVKNLIVSKDGVIKGGRIAGDYKLQVAGNTFLVKDGFCIIKEGIIVVDEAELEVAGKFGTFKVFNFSFTEKGVVNGLEKFNWKECENSSLRIDSLEFKDGKILLKKGSIEAKSIITVEFNDVPVESGMLVYKEENMPKAYVKPGYSPSIVKSNTLNVSFMKVGIDGQIVDVNLSTGDTKGLINGTYDLDNGQLNIYRNILGKLEIGLKGEIPIKDAGRNFDLYALPVIESNLDLDGNVISLRARNENEINTLIFGNTVLSRGYLNFTYNSVEMSTNLKLDGFINTAGLVSMLTLGNGVEINDIRIMEDGNFETFETISPCGLYDKDTNYDFETIGIPEQDIDLKTYEGQLMEMDDGYGNKFTNSFVKVMFDQDNHSISFEVNGEYVLSEGMFKGLKNEKVLIDKILIDSYGKISSIESKGLMGDKISFCSAIEMDDPFLKLIPDETGLNFNLLMGGRLKASDKYKKLKELFIDAKSIIIGRDGSFKEIIAGRNISGKVPFIGKTSLRDAYAGIYVSDEKELKLYIKGTVLLPIDAGEVYAQALELEIRSFVMNSDGDIEKLDIGTEMPGETAFIGVSRLVDAAVSVHKDDEKGIWAEISGSVIIPDMIEGEQDAELKINKLVVDADAKLIEMDIKGVLPKKLSFLGGTVLEDSTLGLVKEENSSVELDFSGNIVLPQMEIEELSGLKLGINSLRIGLEGDISVVDANLKLAKDIEFYEGLVLKDGTVGVVASDDDDIRIVLGGILVLPDNLPGDLSGAEIIINACEFGKDGKLINLDSSLTFESADFMGVTKLKNTTVKILKDSVSGIRIEVDGKIQLPENAPGALKSMELNIESFKMDLKGEILEFAASTKVNEKSELFGEYIVTENLEVSAYRNDNKDMEFSVGGQFYFKGYSDSTEQCPLVVNSFIINEDGTIKALDMKAEGINTGLFGLFELSDGILAVKKGDSEESTIDIKGRVRTSDNFPSGLKGKTLNVNSCLISLDGDIKNFEAVLGDTTVFGGFGLRNGTVYIREYDGEKCAGIGGQLVLGQNYPEGIKGKVLDIKSFILGRDGSIKDLDIGIEGINAVLFDSLQLTEGSIKALKDKNDNLMFSVTGNLALGDVFPESIRSKSITLKKLNLSSGGIKDFEAVLEGEVDFELPGGIEVKANSVGLSREGLSASGSLILPQNYPEGFKGLRIDVRKLEMGWDGKVKAIYTTTSQFQTKLAGFKVEVQDLGFDKDMVKIGSLMLVLPDNMDNMRLGIKNAYITSDGKFHGEFAASDIKKDIGGCNLKLTGLSLDIFEKRINFEKAVLSLPDELGGSSVGLNGVELDSDGIKFKGGAFRLPSFNISNAVTISNSYVDFKIEGKNDFYIEGGAAISIAEIGSFEGIISFGNRSDEYPIGLRRAEFTCSIPGTGIPIANSGLYIKTITGGIAFGPPYELPSKVRNMFDSGMRIKVGVGFKDASGGTIVNGSGLMWIDLTNCGIALKGDVTVVSGCARGEIVAAITRQGFYGDVGIEMNFVRGRVTIYVYKYNGSTSVSGKSKLEIGVEKGAILDKKIGWGKLSFRLRIPPRDFWLGSVNADFGRFTNGSNGVKAYVSLPWGIGEIGVFASKHSMKVGKVSSYDIYLPPWAQYGSRRIYASTEVNGDFSIPDQHRVVYNFDVGGLSSGDDLGRVLLTVAYLDGEPEIVLRSPSGKCYGIDSPNVFVSYHDWGMLIAVLDPDEGQWSIEASNVANKNEFDVQLFGIGKVPKINIESVSLKDSKALVKGFAVNCVKDARVDVYLSDDKDSHMGIPAGTCKVYENGAFGAEIDLMAFPNGEYYVCAVLVDSEDNPDVSDVYENTVHVELEHLSLKAVTGFVASDDGKGGIRYMFEDTNGKNTRGFKLYTHNTTKNEQMVINLGYITQNTLPGFDKGDIVELEVAPYDFDGNEGEKSSPIVVEMGAQKDNINTFTVGKIEDINICSGKSGLVKFDILNQNPVVTGGAYDYASFKVLEIPNGIDINAENYIKICSPINTMNFEIFALNELEPGKYTIKGILENMGNNSIIKEMAINVNVSYSDISLNDTDTVFITPSEGYEVEIHGENFNNHTKVFVGERAIEAQIIDQDVMIVKVPENLPFGETELMVVGANKDSHKIRVEIIEPSYKLMLSKNETFIAKGKSDSVQVFAKTLNGFTKNIQLSANDVPEDWKVHFEKEFIKPDEIGIMHIEVPQNAMGVYYLSVVSDIGEKAVLKVTVTEEEHDPYISKLSINRGVEGDKIKIYGGCFKPDGKVYLGDSELIVASVDDNSIEVVIPEDTHTGNISYKQKGKEYVGPRFNILTDIKLVVASGEVDSKGFYKTKPQVELYSMLQDNSGINYRVNGGEYKVYTGMFVVPQGINTVEAFIRDENGNTLSKCSRTVKYKEEDTSRKKSKTEEITEETVTVPVEEIPADEPSDVAVSKLHKAYIKGYSDGTIRPDKEITRAEIAAIFANLLGIEGSEEGSITYIDLKDEHWACDAIRVVTKAGIFKGYEDGTFRPDEMISRAELSVVISNYLKIDVAKPNKINYPDTEGHWALNFIEEINGHNIVKGYEDGTFRPDAKVKRCDAVTMINRMLNRGPLKSYVNPFTDLMDSHWAYEDLMEASIDHYFTLDQDGNEILKVSE